MKRDKIFVYEAPKRSFLRDAAVKNGYTLTPMETDGVFVPAKDEFTRIMRGIVEAHLVLVDLTRESETVGFIVGHACCCGKSIIGWRAPFDYYIVPTTIPGPAIITQEPLERRTIDECIKTSTYIIEDEAALVRGLAAFIKL